MYKIKTELINNEFSPEILGAKFNKYDLDIFIVDLRQKIKSDPSIRFNIIADWISVQKTRSAKALLDLYQTILNIDSITILATRQQYEEDINAFESGLKWKEVLD